MTLRSRGAVSKAINPNEENENAKAKAKPNLRQHVTTRRPAFDEITNKIDGETKRPLKRSETLKDPRKQALARENRTLSLSYSTRLVEEIIDPDAQSKNDPRWVAEYAPDIYKYLRDVEVLYEVDQNFLECHQTTPKMRAKLVDWLVTFQIKCKAHLETLHLAISIIDRYLQVNKDVGTMNLQLVGVASIWLATKYEEMYPPDSDYLVYSCDKGFTVSQIVDMEIVVLKGIDFCLGKPTAIHFLRRYSKIAQANSDHCALAKYLIELALLEHSLSHVRSSILAAAACCLSQAIINEVTCPSKVWTATLERYTTYKYSDFKTVVVSLAKVLARAELSKNQASRTKYSSAGFEKIALRSNLKGKLVRKLISETPKLRQS